MPPDAAADPAGSALSAPDRQRLTPRARRTLLALFASTTVFTLGDGTMQVLIAPYLEGEGLSQGAIGRTVAVCSVTALVFRFVTGSVYRPERTVWLVPAGCVLEALAFVLIARSSDPLLLTALVAMNGAGFALASTGGLAAIMDVTDGRDAGAVMGWYTGFIGAGYALAGFVGGWLGDRVGIASALTLLAVVPLVAGTALGSGLRRLPAGGAPADDLAVDPAPSRWHALAGFRNAGPIVWLAVVVAMQINLVSGVLGTFFPLYGLAIGLSLTQVGALTGMHSAVSSAVRFLTPPLFRRVSHRSVLPWMVVLGGLAVAALTISTAVWVLAIAWAGVGLSRGLLRVSSAALVTEATGSAGRGAASGLYLAGLDVGKIIGPVLGGLGVEALGYEPTFLITGAVVPAVYFALRAVIARGARQRPQEA